MRETRRQWSMSTFAMFLSLLITLAIPPNLPAQTFVELDADGVLGNGPDVIGGSPADTVRVDVYLHHPEFFCSAQVVLCASCAVVDTVLYRIGWTPLPPEISGDCLTLGAAGFSFCEPLIEPPVHYATVWYVIQECECLVAVDELESNWTDISFNSGNFQGSVPISLCAGPTQTEGSSWGSLKQLFR